MPDPVEQISAATQALLQPLAQRVEQQIAAKAQELLPRIQSGALSPGDALLNLQRAGERVVGAVQAPTGATQRQAQQVARRAARRALDQAGSALNQARGQLAARAGAQRMTNLLDPVAALLGGGNGSGGGGGGGVLLPTAAGAGLGALVGHASGHTVAGAAVGGLLGVVASFLMRR